MLNRWSFKQRSTWALIATPVLAIGGLAVVAANPAAAHPAHPSTATAAAVRWIKPNKYSEVDCNGWSHKYPAVDQPLRMRCTDPHGKYGYEYGHKGRKGYARFMDNGHYVGHDEPTVKFISSAPDSANTMTWFMQLPHDPAAAATNDGKVVDYGELSPAPWYGLPICDPRSYPQNPCKPDSDSNPSGITNPKDAGSAFMELQFYAPGFAGPDAPGCTATQWCSALNIDSLESQFNFVNLNPNCMEPINFAFIARNGVPAGPPSPQLSNFFTNQPNAETLYMNAGDTLKVSISDPAAGLTVRIDDLTTGQSGFMVASAKNGFMDTNYKTCAGTPFNFHAEFNTAAAQNRVPWAALEGGVLMEQEIGHSEVCQSLTNNDPLNVPGQFTDNHVFDTCVGTSEGGTTTVGEGSCSTTTGVCQNAETQGTTGPEACPSDSFVSGQLCEYADGYCVPQGSRTVTWTGKTVTLTSPVNLCSANRFQNGDLDYDGTDYRATSWPDGSANVPTSFRYVGPFDSSGKPYPQIQFQTDAPGSNFLCDPFKPPRVSNCTVPPLSANFYPFWTITNRAHQGLGDNLFPANTCVWNFGNVIPGVTTQNFGKASEYGIQDPLWFGGTNISAVMANPQTAKGCPALKA